MSIIRHLQSGLTRRPPPTGVERPVAERRDGLVRGLKGKNVLITGGTSGIGQAIAVRFAEYGANIAINYLRAPEEASETEEQVHSCLARVRQMGVRTVLVGGDVSNEEAVVAMVDSAVEQLGDLDVLVNNAGIEISQPSHEVSAAEFDKVLGVNLRGSFLCARETIKTLLGGRERPASSSTSRASTSSFLSPTTSVTRRARAASRV